MKFIFTFFSFIAFIVLLVIQYSSNLQFIEDILSSQKYAIHFGKTTLTIFVILKAIFTLIVGLLVTSLFISFGKKRILKIAGVSYSTKLLLAKIFQIVFYFLFFVLGFAIVGIDLGVLAFLGGGIGLGLGFGLQKIAGNFISGLIILNEKSIRINDLIELADGTMGYVRKIASRYVLIETFDGRDILVPNENMVISNVTNWTLSNAYRRIKIKVGVAYGSNLEEVKKLIVEAAKKHPKCMDTPAPACYLEEFGDSSVNLFLLFWVSNLNEGIFGPKSEVMMEIWRLFKENNISIPFPQTEVRIHK